MSEHENRYLRGLAFKWWALILVLGIAGSAITLALKPTFLGFERDVFVASHQYQEAHETQLALLIEKKEALSVRIAEATDRPELQRALKGQRRAIESRIRTERRKLNQ